MLNDRGWLDDDACAAVEGLGIMRNLATDADSRMTIEAGQAAEYLVIADMALYALRAANRRATTATG